MSTVDVVIETPVGSIKVSLAAEKAPITTTNFLYYVDAGLYNGGRFHRTVRLDNQSNTFLKVAESDSGIAATADAKLPNDRIPIEVIQGGIDPGRKSEQLAGIPLERTSITGLQHVDGTISMGRRTEASAVSEFFICINDQPDLDFGGMRNLDGQGFAAFGQVTSGMEVARAIQTMSSDGQSLTPPIPITRIYRADLG